MKQYNLLVVGSGHASKAFAPKVFSRNRRIRFAFQALNAREAKLLLQRLHIDILLLDLDQEDHQIQDFNRDFPELLIMGMSQHPNSLPAGVDPLQNILLSKNDLPGSLSREIKLLSRKSAAEKPPLMSRFGLKKQTQPHRHSLNRLAKN